MKISVFSRTASLHRDVGGQVSFLALFGAVALFGLVGMVMSTGDQLSQKMQMQDTVDAAALSGGTWIARGLNVTSAFNVIQSQLVSGAILLDALDHALEQSRPRVEKQISFYTFCAPFSPPCEFALQVTQSQLQVLSALIPVVDGLKSTLAECDHGLFWLIAKSLERLNGAVHQSFYRLAAAEARDVARRNGAANAVLVPGPIVRRGRQAGRSSKFPTKRGSFSEFCDPMIEGSPEEDERGYHFLLGYPVDVGPYRLGKKRLRPFLRSLTGVPPVGWRLFERRADEVTRRLVEGDRGSCRRILPKPYLLQKDRNALMYLAVAAKPNRQVFFRGEFIAEPPELLTYAQVEIYNGIHEDAFSQDWRVRLAPARLLDSPTRGATGFDELDRLLRPIREAGNVRLLNNH